jgi:hypothetical protein
MKRHAVSLWLWPEVSLASSRAPAAWIVGETASLNGDRFIELSKKPDSNFILSFETLSARARYGNGYLQPHTI